MRGSAEPFFSIVTATFNAESDIGRLRDSVLAQTEESWEWIVQDGASADGTVEQVRAVSDARVRLHSAQDTGIYDGLNRALDRVRGEYVLVLGADDMLAHPDVLLRLHEVIVRAAAAPDVVLASVEVEPGRYFSSSLGWKTLLVNTVHHQGAAYAHSQFSTFRFDTGVKVVADYEHSLLLRLGRAQAVSTDLIIARCGAEGVSRRVDERILYGEMHALRSKHLPVALSKVLQYVGLANVLRRRLSPHRAAPTARSA